MIVPKCSARLFPILEGVIFQYTFSYKSRLCSSDRIFWEGGNRWDRGRNPYPVGLCWRVQVTTGEVHGTRPDDKDKMITANFQCDIQLIITQLGSCQGTAEELLDQHFQFVQTLQVVDRLNDSLSG